MARSASTFLAAVVFALALPAVGEAACPRLIMVRADPLAAPILIQDYDEACKLYWAFFASPAAEATTRFATRASLQLALFWYAPRWEPYVREHRLAELQPDDADQFGRFYPAVGEEPALVETVPRSYGQWPKVVNETALRILQAHGIPTRVDETAARGVPWVAAGVVGAALLAVPLLLVARSRR